MCRELAELRLALIAVPTRLRRRDFCNRRCHIAPQVRAQARHQATVNDVREGDGKFIADCVNDFGREHDHYYLAMEYLSGRPLVRVMIDAYTNEQGIDKRNTQVQ